MLLDTGLNCCSTPALREPLTDLGHADSFEFMLGICDLCGADWMNVFCVASVISGNHRVTRSDAEAMRARGSGKELKSLMREWLHNNIN
jgi:hypothetical protein